MISDVDFSRLVDEFNSTDADIIVGARQSKVDVPFGVISLDGDMVESIEEKPAIPLNVNAGIYIFSPQFVNKQVNVTYQDMPDLINKAISEDIKVRSFMVYEGWRDLGSHSDLRKARLDL